MGQKDKRKFKIFKQGQRESREVAKMAMKKEE